MEQSSLLRHRDQTGFAFLASIRLDSPTLGQANNLVGNRILPRRLCTDLSTLPATRLDAIEYYLAILELSRRCPHLPSPTSSPKFPPIRHTIPHDTLPLTPNPTPC